MSESLKKLRKENYNPSRAVDKIFTLLFIDGTTERVPATGFTAAWIKGKIRAAEKRTYLLRVE